MPDFWEIKLKYSLSKPTKKKKFTALVAELLDNQAVQCTGPDWV